MSGPVRPPLTVAESDGTPTIRPCTEIVFDSADFIVTDNGTSARINNHPGAGASLTDTYVGFGSAANLLTGSTKLTWNDTAGSEQLKVSGSGVTDGGILIENTNTGVVSAPDLVLHRNVTGTTNDYIGRIDMRGQDSSSNDVDYLMMTMKIHDAVNDAGRLGFFVSGNASLNADDSQLMIFGRSGLSGNPGLVSINNAARSDVDFRVSGDTNANIIRTDASIDALGIGTAPTSGYSGAVVRTHILQANDGIALLLEDDQADADVGPQLVFHRDSASPAADDILGRIRFEGDDSGGNPHGYSRITSQIRDPTDGAEYGRTLFENRANGQLYESMRFDGTSVIFNNSKNLYQDLTVWGDNDATIYSDAGNDNVTMGSTTSDSAVERLEVVGTGTGTLMRLTSTDADANSAPELSLWRNSATSATDDIVGQIRFEAETQSSGIKVTAATFYTKLKAVSGDAVDSEIFCDIRVSNTSKNMMKLGNTEVVFNDDSADVDFRIESDDNANMFKIDANNNQAGIGAAPSSSLGKLQINVGNSTATALTLISTDADAAVSPVLDLYRNSGTPAASDLIGQVTFSGEDSVAAKIDYGMINVRIESAGATESSSMEFDVARSGTLQTNFRIRYSEVVVNEDTTDCNFRVESNGNSHMFQVDAGAEGVAVGAQYASGGAQFQVDEDASFVSYLANQNTSGIVDASLQKNGHIICNPSGGNIVVTLGASGAAGEKVTICNVAADGSNVLLAVAVGDSTLTTPATFVSGDSETWLCYKDLNWMRVNFQT